MHSRSPTMPAPTFCFRPMRGWRPCVFLLLFVAVASREGATAAADLQGGPANHPAVAEPAELEDLWCRYGLAGCTKAAYVFETAMDGVQQQHGGKQTAGVSVAAGRQPPNTAPHDASTRRVAEAEHDHKASMESTLTSSKPPETIQAKAARHWAGLGGHAVAAAAGRTQQAAARLLLQVAEASTAATGSAQPATAALDTQAAEAATAAKAAVAQAVQSAAYHAASVPAWALLLLGGSVALVAAVHLWHCLPHRGLLRRESSDQAVLQPMAIGQVREEAAAAGLAVSVDEERPAGLAHAGLAFQPAAPTPRSASGASRQHWKLAGRRSGGSSSSSSSESDGGSSNGIRGRSSGSSSPRTAAATDVSVDPSVRIRDVSQTGWAAVAAPDAGTSSTVVFREGKAATFRNPLYSSSSSDVEGESAPYTACESSTSAVPSPTNRMGEHPGSGSSIQPQWQAKHVIQLGRVQQGSSDTAEGSFRLAAAGAGMPVQGGSASSSTAGSPRDGYAPLPAPGSTGSSRIHSRAASLNPPGSPSKRFSGAARKLTGARSIGPQALEPLGEEEWLEEEANVQPGGRPQPHQQVQQHPAACSGLQAAEGSTLQQEQSAGTVWTVEASACTSHQQQQLEQGGAGASTGTAASASSTLAAIPGLVLLTLQQFQEEVKLGELLGVGAAGCVYAGEWRGRRVAVKQIHPTTADEASFIREVEMMASVGSHPHIISVLAACLQPPLAVVQELAAISLHHRLHHEHCRPRYGTFLQLAEDVAAALAHCHSRQSPVVHRDLSAKNVLLGFDGRARLADFGLAAARHRTFLSNDKAGALGTAAYMAPECMQRGQITERCDAFSYGVLCWEMLTGRPAWEECSHPVQIMFAVGVERRRLPIPAGCPPALGKLLKECWRHNAPLRPAFAEILQRLRQMRSQDSFRTLKLPAVPAGTVARDAGASKGSVVGAIAATAKLAGRMAGSTKAGLGMPAAVGVGSYPKSQAAA